MIIIRPVTINDSTLTSSTVPETDYSAWTTTTYAAGANVIRGHRRFRSLQGSNTNHDPLLDDQDAPVWWVDMGPTNQYAMFDDSVGTSTTAVDEVEVVLAPGRVDSLALLDVEAELVQVTMTVDGDIVYQKTQSTYGTGQAITNLYLYFTARIGRRSVLLFMDLPRYPNGIVTITATAAAGETVAIGTMKIGQQFFIGSTEAGVKAGITDYSKVDTDEFGNRKVIRRNYAKRNSMQLQLANELVDFVFKTLADLRGVPIVWIASTRFDCLVTFGIYTEFEIDIAYFNISFCSLSTLSLV